MTPVVFVLVLLACACYLVAVLATPWKSFLALLPLMVVTRSVVLPVVGERITAFDALLVIWWIGIALRRLAGQRDLHLSPVILGPAVAYCGFLTAAVLSLWSAPSLVSGAVEIAVFVFVGLWALTVVGVANSADRIERIARWILWVVLGTSVISLAEGMLGPLGLFPTRGSGSRLSGPFRQTNQLASYLRMTMPLLWGALALRPTLRWETLALAGSTVASMAVVALTSSRSNILLTAGELLLCAAAALWLTRRVGLRVYWRPVALVLLLVPLGVLSVPWVAPHYWATFLRRVLPLFEGLLSGGGGWSSALPSTREAAFSAANWSMAWQAFCDNPFLGVGIGNFRLQYEIVEGMQYEVHSLYFGILAETGIFGLVAVLVLLAILVMYAWRLLRAARPPIWVTVGLVVALAGSLVGGVWIRFLRTREFWLLSGLLLAQYGCSFPRTTRQSVARSTEHFRPSK